MCWYTFNDTWVSSSKEELETRSSILKFKSVGNIFFLKSTFTSSIRLIRFNNNEHPIKKSLIELPIDKENDLYKFFYFITDLGKVWEMKFYNRGANWKTDKLDFNLIFSSDNEKIITYPTYNHKNIIYFASDKNNVYEYNPNIEKIIKIINTNSSIYAVKSQSKYHDKIIEERERFFYENSYTCRATPESIEACSIRKKEKIIETNNKLQNINDRRIVIGTTNGEVYEYWSFRNWKNDNIRNLLKFWKQDFDKWNKEVLRQFTQDVPSLTNAQKRIWIDDKNFQLRTQLAILQDKIAIIKNHDEIKNIQIDLWIINNKITYIYERISNLRNELLSKINIVDEKSEWCKENDNADTWANIFSNVPVLSEITSGIKSITTIGCQLIPKYEELIKNATPGRYRKKRNIISNTTKWTNDFTKSINNEQHLPIINNTNFVKSNITSL